MVSCLGSVTAPSADKVWCAGFYKTFNLECIQQWFGLGEDNHEVSHGLWCSSNICIRSVDSPVKILGRKEEGEGRTQEAMENSTVVLYWISLVYVVNS